MVRTRKRGERLPDNYVKIAILLFIGDDKKAQFEIKEYLKQVHGIAEKKGIRLHLSKLCQDEYLQEESEPGKPKYYQWKKSVNSFKKIIELISKNAEIVKSSIIEIKNLNKTKTITKAFQIKKLSRTEDFDPTKYWYNTNYAKSFFNESTLKSCLEEAYKNYSTEKGKYPLDESEFKTVVLENNDIKTIVTLMHYSPNLVNYIIDLAKSYKQKIEDLDKKENKIFLTILDDIIHGNYFYHVKGWHFTPEPNIETISSKDFKGLRLEFRCSLADPKHPVLLFERGGTT